MAMAEIFLPELSGSDDHYPRAPPPSPEMQPRNHARVFEIPASKFEGIGLDLRRNTFPLDEDDESPFGAHHMVYDDEKRESPVHLRDYDDDNSLPGSPQKRVCCSPCTLPSGFLTTAFPSSNQDSLVSSGFGSLQQPFHSSGGATGSWSNSGAPFFSSSRPYPLTNPHLVTERVTMQASADLCTPAPLYPVTTPSSDNTLLSRSYDLHSIHPHLPHSFEATQLPEVRPSRSRTLDSSYVPQLEEVLDVNSGEDPNQRRRKISVKRKNPDECGEDDSNLQFNFEYSYSSTGSSGEADWVMVDCKVESSWPMGKKACCADDPSSVAVSHRQRFGGSPLPFSGGGLFVPRLNPLDLSSSGSSTGFSPFANLAQFTQQQDAMGVVIDRVVTPTNHYANLLGSEPVMMDCEGRLDSLDGMDCEQFPMGSPTAADRYGDIATPAFGGVHLTGGDGSAPIPATGMEQGLLVLRQHHREDNPAVSRHSCVDEYLQAPQKHKGQGSGSGVEVSMSGDLDMARLNLSKSL